MQRQQTARQIEIAYHRSFRRAVKILANAVPSRSADQVPHLFPADSPCLKPRRTLRGRRNQARIIRIEALPHMDWRILGDHDPELVANREEVVW
jgi:hypothetical protein